MLPNQIPAASPEVVALASAIADVLNGLKSGQNPLAAAEAALPDLLSASTAMANIGADIKLASNQAYILWAIGSVYEPAPAATTPAA